MSSVPDPTRRSERSHRAILEAVTELIVEQGYERVSVESIARRAGVGKQTIYRWWPSKGAVALEALHTDFATVGSFPDTGDIVADLRTQMLGVSRALATTVTGPLCRALVAAAQSDPELSLAHLEQVIRPATVACHERLGLAIERGELRADVDPQMIIDLLYGAIYYRLLIHTRPLADEQIDAALEMVFAGLR